MARLLDRGRRRRVGAMIPELCSQFVGFMINTEYDAFVPAIARASNRVRYLTHFRKSNRGIDVSEREKVRTLFKQLVDPRSGSDLSDDGVKRLNAYASGGYDYLSTERDLKPHSAEEFLESFALLIRKAAGDGKSAETPGGREAN